MHSNGCILMMAVFMMMVSRMMAVFWNGGFKEWRFLGISVLGMAVFLEICY